MAGWVGMWVVSPRGVLITGLGMGFPAAGFGPPATRPGKGYFPSARNCRTMSAWLSPASMPLKAFPAPSRAVYMNVGIERCHPRFGGSQASWHSGRDAVDLLQCGHPGLHLFQAIYPQRLHA